VEESLSREVVHGGKRIKLVAVARAQRVMILLVIAMMAVLAGTFVLMRVAPAAGWAGAVLYPVGVVVAIVQAARLADASGGNVVMAVVGAVFMLIPVYGLIALALINQRAIRLLQEAGAHVGLLGVSAQEMTKLVQGACPKCGYDIRGLPGRVCPECGEVFGAPAGDESWPTPTEREAIVQRQLDQLDRLAHRAGPEQVE
jgi:hypothetical protein